MKNRIASCPISEKICRGNGRRGWKSILFFVYLIIGLFCTSVFLCFFESRGVLNEIHSSLCRDEKQTSCVRVCTIGLKKELKGELSLTDR